MPCEFVIDADRHLIRMTIRGAVTKEELLAFRDRLARDPTFARDLPMLIDVRDTNADALTSLDIRALAEASKVSPGVRRAFVATDAMTLGLARLFGTYRELLDGQEHAAVFTTLESAERWLTEPTGPDPSFIGVAKHERETDG